MQEFESTAILWVQLGHINSETEFTPFGAERCVRLQ